MIDNRIDRLRTEPLTLGILGMGYVGLPLAVEAARGGLRVLGFDISTEVVERINAGDSHIGDVSSEELAKVTGTGALEATTDMSRLSECDAISICVPTPLSKTRDPDISYIVSATKAVADHLVPGQLVILESTTYPGTTREVVLPGLEAGGLSVGEGFYLCFSPERVDPGNERWKTRNTPKVIGGVTPQCLAAGIAVYERFFDQMVPVSSAEAAELSKILENTFRAVNIGLVNEIALIADRLGVDVWEVIEAADTKPFGFMKFTPGPGLGGHCIPIDPHYLSWKMRTLDFRTRFIELASEINSEMPAFVVGKVRTVLNDGSLAVRDSKVLVLGAAYKPDIDDVRESPALEILRLLEDDGAVVSYHDPFVARVEEEGRIWTSVELTDDALSSADAVVIVTDHSEIDYARVLRLSRRLVDARNATAALTDSDRASGHPQRWIVKS